MSAIVEINELDLVVYGQVQYDFTLDAKTGLALDEMLVKASGQRAVAVEQELATISIEAKQRSRKAEDVGRALGLASAIVAEMSQIEGVDLTTEYDDKHGWLKTLATVVAPYDLTYVKEKDETKTPCPISDLWKDKLTYEGAQRLQSILQLALDKENNALKQTSNTIQGFVSKRDKAYELIGKVQKKIDSTASTTIMAIGS